MASCSFASQLPAPSSLPSPRRKKTAARLRAPIVPPPLLRPVLGKTQASGPWACCHWKSFPPSAQREESPHFTEQKQSPSVFCSGKSWSRKEIELILGFPRAFGGFSAFRSSLTSYLADTAHAQFSLPWEGGSHQGEGHSTQGMEKREAVCSSWKQ